MTSAKLAVLMLVLMIGPAQAQSPGEGWNSKGSTEPAPMIEEVEPLSEADALRYAEVGLEIVEAINSENEKAYRALFTDAGWESSIDWVKEMFAVQTARWGRIDLAYQPIRGVIRMGKMGFRGDERDGATMIAIFEEPVGCALSFELDGEGKIVHTSVFIKQELSMVERDGSELIYELATENEAAAEER